MLHSYTSHVQRPIIQSFKNTQYKLKNINATNFFFVVMSTQDLRKEKERERERDRERMKKT